MITEQELEDAMVKSGLGLTTGSYYRPVISCGCPLTVLWAAETGYKFTDKTTMEYRQEIAEKVLEWATMKFGKLFTLGFIGGFDVGGTLIDGETVPDRHATLNGMHLRQCFEQRQMVDHSWG